MKVGPAEAAHPNGAQLQQLLLCFESQDEDTCPAECVIEIDTPAEFKQKCKVFVFE